MKPRIGITFEKTLSEKYITAIKSIGGEPILLESSRVSSGSSDCDALILSGGGDILPELFGVHDYDKSLIRSVSVERDRFELKLAEYAFSSRLPTLGICRGAQIMTAALGGQLHLDIQGHMQTIDRSLPSHSVITEDGSRLFELIGKECEVNSLHHQAAKKLPNELFASAYSKNDGIIEGIEASGQFFIGVQWHPECLLDRSSERILQALVTATESR